MFVARVKKSLLVIFLLLVTLVMLSSVIVTAPPLPLPECFVAGTQILMADNTTKPIENIIVGDEVLSPNGVNTVKNLYHYILGNQPIYSINNNIPFVTKPHPFKSTDGWKAINVKAAKEWNPRLAITKLTVGDVLLTRSGTTLVTSITPHAASYTTPIYNFAVDGDEMYYANGYVVHNKCVGGTNADAPCSSDTQCPGGYCDSVGSTTCYRCECGSVETKTDTSCTGGWSLTQPSSCSDFPCTAYINCTAGGSIWCGTTSSGYCKSPGGSATACTVEYSQSIKIANANTHTFRFNTLTVKSGKYLQFYVDTSATTDQFTPYYKGYAGDLHYLAAPLPNSAGTLSCYYPINGQMFYTQGGTYDVGDDFYATGTCGVNGVDNSWEYSGGAGGLGGYGPVIEGQVGSKGHCECNSYLEPAGGAGGASGARIDFSASSITLESSSSLRVNGLNGQKGGDATASTCRPSWLAARRVSGGAGGGGGGAGGNIIITTGTLNMNPLAHIYANGGQGGQGGEAQANPYNSRYGCFGGSGSGGMPGKIEVHMSNPSGSTYKRSNFVAEPGAGGIAPVKNACHEIPTPGYTPFVGENTAKNTIRICGKEVCDGRDNDCDGQVDEGLDCTGMVEEFFSFDTCALGVEFKSSVTPDTPCNYGSICSGTTSSSFCTSFAGLHRCFDDPGTTDATACLTIFRGPTNANTNYPDATSDAPCSWVDHNNGQCMCDPDKNIYAIRYYYDHDGDGFGTTAHKDTCNPGDEPFYTAIKPGDCDDNDPLVQGGPDICDGLDNDCNPATKDGSAEAWYLSPTTCGVAPCTSAGVFNCSGGHKVDTCVDTGCTVCTFGSDCASGEVCVEGICNTTCTNGKFCSDDSVNNWTSDGMCTTGGCDENLATTIGASYQDTCTAATVTTPCDPDHLALDEGGYDTSGGFLCTASNKCCFGGCCVTGAEVCNSSGPNVDENCNGLVDEGTGSCSSSSGAGSCSGGTVDCSAFSGTYPSEKQRCYDAGCLSIANSATGYCSGDSHCSSLAEGACETDASCTWNDGFTCFGGPSCSAVSDKDICKDGGCTYTPDSCSSYTDRTACESNGCTFTCCDCLGTSCNPANDGTKCNGCSYVPATSNDNACNGVDDNCNGVIDEGASDFLDANQNGVCAGNTWTCAQAAGQYWVKDAGWTNSSPETCGDGDEDCDGLVDEEGALGCTPYYFDNDGDTYYASGAPSKCLCAPDAVTKYTGVTSGDCDDTDASIHPGAPDTIVDTFGQTNALCDGVDSDCSDGDGDAIAQNEKGLVDCYPDWDSDYVGADTAAGPGSICSSNPNFDAPESSSNKVCDDIIDGNSYVSNYTFYTTDVNAVSPNGTLWDDFPFDCDDTDASAYWKCCGGGLHLENMKTGAPGHWNQVDNIDYPWNIGGGTEFNIYTDRAACCDDTSDCVYDDAILGYSCKNKDDYLTEGGDDSSDISITCSANNAWVDCDDDATSCTVDCGFANAWVSPDSLEIPFGGYTSASLRPECCGDDANEFLSVGACLASSLTNMICCNASGMYNLDGHCVKHEDCPDIMRTAPVWVEYPHKTQAELDAVEASLGSQGYCCNGQTDDSATKPLCIDPGISGCYVNLQPVNINSPPKRTMCASDDQCVLEESVSPDSPFSVCEKSTLCSASVHKLDYKYLAGSVLCDGSYTKDSQTVGCYPEYDGVTDTTNCTSVPMTICTGSNCHAICHEDNGVLSSCSEECESYSCHTVTTLRGPDCTASSNMVCASRVSVDTSSIDPQTCHPASHCNEFGCWADSCSPCTSSGCPACTALPVYTKDVSCSDFFACTPFVNVANGISCLNRNSSQKFPLVINESGGNGIIQCSSHDPSTEGDLWCTPSSEYYIAPGGEIRCKRETSVCDSGPVTNLLIGCDAFTTPANDSWGRYNTGCVFNDSAIATTLQTYDGACCLTSVLNNFQLYTKSNREDFVRVY